MILTEAIKLSPRSLMKVRAVDYKELLLVIPRQLTVWVATNENGVINGYLSQPLDGKTEWELAPAVLNGVNPYKKKIYELHRLFYDFESNVSDWRNSLVRYDPE